MFWLATGKSGSLWAGTTGRLPWSSTRSCLMPATSAATSTTYPRIGSGCSRQPLVDRNHLLYGHGPTGECSLPGGTRRGFLRRFRGQGERAVFRPAHAPVLDLFRRFGCGLRRPDRVNSEGKVFVTGSTLSTDLPVTANALQTKSAKTQDAFLAELDPAADGTESLVYATYLGGAGLDAPTALTLGQNGSVFVAGYTASTDVAWIKSDSMQASNRGGWDAFVVNLDPAAASGSPPVCLLPRRPRTDVANGLAVDAPEISTFRLHHVERLPHVRRLFQCSLSSLSNAFIAKINPSLTGLNGLVYTSFLGAAARTSQPPWRSIRPAASGSPATRFLLTSRNPERLSNHLRRRHHRRLPHAARPFTSAFPGHHLFDLLWRTGADISYALLPAGARQSPDCRLHALNRSAGQRSSRSGSDSEPEHGRFPGAAGCERFRGRQPRLFRVLRRAGTEAAAISRSEPRAPFTFPVTPTRRTCP